jgi:hypothetical protein
VDFILLRFNNGEFPFLSLLFFVVVLGVVVIGGGWFFGVSDEPFLSLVYGPPSFVPRLAFFVCSNR